MKTTASLSLPFLLAAVAAAQSAASEFGHARTRELAELGLLPKPIEVAVADIVNYHRHRLPLPRPGEVVALDLRFGGEAARMGDEVFVQVGFTTATTLDGSDLPPLNLALVVDCSGSMAAEGKLDAVKAALKAFVPRLRASDRCAVVAYSDDARVVAGSRAVGDGRWLCEAIASLEPRGSTNLDGGLQLGLKECARELAPRGSNRVILLTDGIANRGVTEPEAILRGAQRFTAEDIDLTTVGVGRDLDTSLLDRLARGGRGLFHFVADGKDVQKVFVDEAESLLAPAARAAELRLRMPRGLDVLEIYGHDARRLGDGELAIALPDMNRGLTAIVMLRCRVAAMASERLEVEADLTARAANATASRIELRQHATLRVDDRGGDTFADAEVKKNATIAQLAQGMHVMAELAQQQRWAEAERAVRSAIDVARERLPRVADEDVRTVLAMAESHLAVLRKQVDRFRDW